MKQPKRKSDRFPSALRVTAVVILCFFVLTVVFMFTIHAFLAQTSPVHGEYLVVEGWLPDYALEEALQKFRTDGYRMMITSGEPLSRGFALAEYKTHAEFARAIPIRMGGGADSIIAVPSPAVAMDRTYAAAIAVTEWFDRQGGRPSSLDVFSHGAHSRRSGILFQRALGDSVRVGVFSGADRTYDGNRWWKTSRGFQDVVMETIGLTYACVLPPDRPGERER